MPYRDGTGPDGRGPLTGRGMGRCVGFPFRRRIRRVVLRRRRWRERDRRG